MSERTEVLLELAELWRQEVALGTTQGGGRRYDEHCLLHDKAWKALERLDALTLEGLPECGHDQHHEDIGQPRSGRRALDRQWEWCDA